MNLFGIASVPDYAMIGPADFPVWAGAPRQYRFDGKLGDFNCGDKSLPSLTMQIFDYRWDEGVRWGRVNQAWFDVAFVDHEGVVSQLSLKKDGAINLFDLLIDLRNQDGQEVDPVALEVKLEPVDRTAIPIDGTEGEDIYYVPAAVTCNFLAKSQVDSVREFAASGAFRWLLVGEVEV